MDSKITGNKVVWLCVFICNLLIAVFGALLIVCASLIWSELGKIQPPSVQLLILGVLIIATSSVVIFISRSNPCILFISMIIHFAILVILAVSAVYFTIEFEKFADLFTTAFEDKSSDTQRIKDILQKYFSIIQIGSFIISGIMVR